MQLNKIGILDFGTRIRDYYNDQISIRIIKEAVLADKLGFSRVWYAEHYVKYCNWLSADVLVTLAAAHTNTIKIGVAGALIEYYQPLKIASDYSLLSGIFPGRIDLGLAKGKANNIYEQLFLADRITEKENRKELLKQKIELTIKLVNEEEANIEEHILIPPLKSPKPLLWNLVGSPGGYLQSLDWGINCSRSLFHDSIDLKPGIDELKVYKEAFFKKFGMLPQVNIAIAGTCQKSKGASAKVIDQLKSDKLTGVNLAKAIHGGPSEVFDKLSLLAETYGVDEVIFLELGVIDEQRKSSLKNISRVFNLKGH